MKPVERIMSRRQIRAMVEADEFQLVLTRRAKVDLPDGGWRWGPEVVLPPQTATLLPYKRRMSDMVIDTEQGDLTVYQYLVVAEGPLDILRDDEFEHLDRKFRVDSVDVKTEVRTSASVIYLGRVDG